MSSSDNGSNSSGPNWCFICNINLTPETLNEHFESRTHLNRCLQKGVGISVVPTSERSSTWCSICNHALENATADQHYESRAHLNRCLQRGVGIPVSYGTCATVIPPPAVPRFTQAGAPSSPQGGGGGASGCFPSGSFTGFRPGAQRARPRMTFQQGNKQMGFGETDGQSDPTDRNIYNHFCNSGKKFAMQQQQQPPFMCGGGQSQSNSQMSVSYSGGYGQEAARSSEIFKQYDSSWQNQSSAKNGWPYCDICDQRFQTVGALSQHYSSSSHMEMKAMKQNQFRGCPAQGTVDQSRFYQSASGHIRSQGLNQGAYFGNQVAAQQDAYRNAGQNQGTHHIPKEWRAYNRPVQYHS